MRRQPDWATLPFPFPPPPATLAKGTSGGSFYPPARPTHTPRQRSEERSTQARLWLALISRLPATRGEGVQLTIPRRTPLSFQQDPRSRRPIRLLLLRPRRLLDLLRRPRRASRTRLVSTSSAPSGDSYHAQADFRLVEVSAKFQAIPTLHFLVLERSLPKYDLLSSSGRRSTACHLHGCKKMRWKKTTRWTDERVLGTTPQGGQGWKCSHRAWRSTADAHSRRLALRRGLAPSQDGKQ